MNKYKGKKILILGSGSLRIGQAGEFDYSGSQAIKALNEEEVNTVLVNPNIATVQTDSDMANKVYLQPLNLDVLTRVIEKELPNAIMFGFGGQTALNMGLLLDENGILQKYQVEVLGTQVKTIRNTEDRELFKEVLNEISVKTAKSSAASSVEEALKAAQEIGYPIMMRSGYSLGGLGSGKMHNADELRKKAKEALSGAPQILIEEYLQGWKEIEYEIVRDKLDNTIIVCNMENFDPMGIHTGESIVVAPSQTLSNTEYHLLREVAINTARHLEIVGECNIQYALNPDTGDYRVIEVNARLSRSSALASKATGYPLAFVAAKLALGYSLPQLKNPVTNKTCAFFEPALDYLVVKIPRWDTQKFKSADPIIGSEMKSVGEVMGIGRSFPEALQKAIRMLNIEAHGLTDHPFKIQDPADEIKNATYRRLYAIYEYLKKGNSVKDVYEMSSIDPWFLHQIQDIISIEAELSSSTLTADLLKRAKQWGFADRTIGKLLGIPVDDIRKKRQSEKIIPSIKQIDTLAGEFAAATNYLYMTYHGGENDVFPSSKKSYIVLGSGPYCIGSSIEFDWCAVNTVKAFKRLGEQAIIINCNPATVSTDFDISDRLYFEELTLERICDIGEFEECSGFIVSMGGQIPNNLALPLENSGFNIIGTSAASIDRAENREKFSLLLQEIGIDQPSWQKVTSFEKAKEFADKEGYPLLVRPSYVLSGAAMNVITNESNLYQYLQEALIASKEYPTVISKFILDAKELEIDGVADHGEIVIEAIAEHIENAGVHSGDATFALPPQNVCLETIRHAKKISRSIVKALNITGPFNIQLIAKEKFIQVIECNVRASRSFPFVSKVTNHNFIDIATEVLLGKHQISSYETLELRYVGIKSPQFSYSRLKGVDPVAYVEMASTGETTCIGDNLLEAFYSAWLASEQSLKGRRLLVSISDNKKIKLLEQLRIVERRGWELYSTAGTHHFLSKNGIVSTCLFKSHEAMEPNMEPYITSKMIDLIICIPESASIDDLRDGFILRRLAVDHHIPLITNLQIAQLFLRCLIEINPHNIPVKSVDEFINSKIKK